MKPRAIKGVQTLKAYHPPLSGRDDFLRLDFNEWLGEPHPAIAETLTSFSADKLNMYPESEAAIRGVSRQFAVAEENILLANGVDEAFCNVFRAYLDRGEKILLPNPGYAMMEFYATLCEAAIVNWELDAPEFNYRVEVADRFLADGGKCLAFGQPNNPTGSCIDCAVIREWCRDYPDRLIVVDEAYMEFAEPRLSLLDAVTEFPNLVVFRTFSKAWSLAGMRLGAVLASAELIAELKKMWSPYSVNAMGLSMLANMLPDPGWVANVSRQVSAQRTRLQQALIARGYTTHFGYGNFFLWHLGESRTALLTAFADSMIRLRDHHNKRGLQGWVRVSIGPEEVTDRFLNVLDAVSGE